MPVKHAQSPTAHGIPQRDHAILVAHRQALPVWTECERADSFRLITESDHFARHVELGGLSLGYVFMPLTTLLILLLAATAPQSSSPRHQWSVVAGLLFSLAGDVCLMLPKDLFLAGLLAFLVAHGCYLFAFTADCRFASRLVPFAVWGGIGLVVLVVLWARLPAA